MKLNIFLISIGLFFLTIISLPAQAPNHQTPIGTNLPLLRSWGRDYPFTDAFKYSREWISQCYNCGWQEGGPLMLDSLGWLTGFPEAHPDSMHFVQTMLMDGAFDKPTGTYHLLWEGEGEINIIGDIEEIRVIDDHHWEVDVKEGDFGFWFYIYSTDPNNTGDYIRNTRFILPGYLETYETELFHDRFLEVLRKYTAIRFMDWGETNFNPLETWAQRTTPLHQTQSREVGVSLEYMVALCNELEADMWYCVPHAADDDYVRKAAELIKAQLHPDRKLYLEYSNEVWNFAFGQFYYCAQKGEELGLTEMGNFSTEYFALRVGQIFDIFGEVFGESEQVQNVIAWQNYDVYWTKKVLEYNGNLARTDAVAIAPYFGGITGKPENFEQEKDLSLDEVIDLCIHELTGTMDGIRGQIDMLKEKNLPLIAYEGGQHLVGLGFVREDTAFTNKLIAVNHHPKMKEAYLDYLNRWKEVGGELFMHFNLMGDGSKWGSWGAFDNYSHDRRYAPKQAAIDEFIDNNTPAWWYLPEETSSTPEGDLLINFNGPDSLSIIENYLSIQENRPFQQPYDSLLLIPFSMADGEAVFTSNNSQTTMYGGFKLNYLADTISYLEFGLGNYGQHDGFRCRTGPATSEGILLWRKDQFLNGYDATEKVTLGKLKMEINASYGDDDAANLRFVVKNGDQFYVSDFREGNEGAKVIELDFFNNATTPGRRWFPFDPTTGNLALPIPILPTPMIFDDVQAVGFIFNHFRTQFDTRLEFTNFEAYTRPAEEFTLRLDKSDNQLSPTTNPTAKFTAVFSEPTSDFTLEDIVLSGAAIDENSVLTLTEITPFNGTTYEITVTQLIGNGSIKVTIPKGVATNTNGFTNQTATAINPIVVFAGADAPTVTVNQASGQEDPTLYTPIHFTAVFSKPVIGFDTSAVISKGAATPSLKVITEIAPFDSTTFDIALADFDTNGVVKIEILGDKASLADFAVSNKRSTSLDNAVRIETIPDVANLIDLNVLNRPLSSDFFVQRPKETRDNGHTQIMPFGTTDAERIYTNEAYNQSEFYGGLQLHNPHHPTDFRFPMHERAAIEEFDNPDHLPGNLDLLFLWRKDQFMNNMHLPQVGFNNDATQSSLEINTIQMNNAADLRFVIRNGSTYYFSEPLLTDVDTLGWTENEDFPLPAFKLTDFNNSNEPGKRWANFTPTANDFFLPENPIYQPMNFNDVTEVGFLYKSIGYKRWYLNGFIFDTFKINGVTIASCQSSQSLSAPESINRTVNTSQFITSTATILPTKEIIYEAGENICLLPGFIASAGSNFTARIADCPSPENSTNQSFITHYLPTTIIEKTPVVTVQLSIYPNPFKNTAIINYSLPTDSPTQLTLWNLAGDLLKKWSLGTQSKGRYQMELQKGELPTGIYFLKLQTLMGIETKKVVLSE